MTVSSEHTGANKMGQQWWEAEAVGLPPTSDSKDPPPLVLCPHCKLRLKAEEEEQGL